MVQDPGRGQRRYSPLMNLNGVPLHPLVVHAAVGLVPLAAVFAVLFVVPRWRWLARWPMLLSGVAAALTVQLASMTGEDLQHSRQLESPLIQTHQEWAGRLQVAMWVLAAVVVVAFVLLPHVTRLAGGRDKVARVPALEKPMMVVLPVLAVVVLVLVFLTGDAGARAVWQQ
jgi:uncharacterized membrane protein